MTDALVNSKPNPHIYKFMQRKAPVVPSLAKPRMAKHLPESVSVISYPKDVTETILLCVPAATGGRMLCASVLVPAQRLHTLFA